MNVLQKLFDVSMKINFILLFMILGTSASLADFTVRYCELEGQQQRMGRA